MVLRIKHPTDILGKTLVEEREPAGVARRASDHMA